MATDLHVEDSLARSNSVTFSTARSNSVPYATKTTRVRHAAGAGAHRRV